MSLVLRLAWRNAWRNPRRTGVVVTAVAVGFAGVALSMAFNYGMVFQMVETAISTELGHLQVHAAGFDENPEVSVRLRDGGRRVSTLVAGQDGVRAHARRVRGEGLLTSPRSSVGVRIIGIEPEAESHVTRIADSITEGSFLGGARRKLLLGEDLARRMSVGVGDKVVLSVQDLHGDLAGEGLRVGGLFRTASSALDRNTVYIALSEAQSLLGLDDAVSEIVVVARSRSEIEPIRTALVAGLPGLEVRSWEELQPVLVYLIASFDQSAYLVYAAVFVGMAFGIANVLLMAIYERVREIGILRAMGLRASRLVAMIIAESVFVTMLGIVIGAGVSVACVAALSDGIDLSRYSEGLLAFGVGTRIVPVLRPEDVGTPALVAFVTAVLASVWPAVRAARFRPAEAVRHT